MQCIGYKVKLKEIFTTFFHLHQKKLGSGSSAYSTLASIEFPERFPGKNSVSTVLHSMIVCSDSASDLSHILTCVGKGMTIADNASYKSLLRRFETTQQSLREIRTAAVLYKQSGEYPTHDKIDQFLTSNLSYDGYGNGWGYTPEGKITAAENFNDFSNFIPELLSGAWSGAKVFVGDTIGGAAAAFLFPKDHKMQREILEKTNYGLSVDTSAKSSGYNPNSIMYSLGKEFGQIGSGVTMSNLISKAFVAAHLISPGAKDKFKRGAVMTSAFAFVYASQSFASSFRNIDNYLTNNNKILNENQILKRASNYAGYHALTTFTTTVLTGASFGAYSKMKIFGKNVGIPEVDTIGKLSIAPILHGSADVGHQIIDFHAGVLDDIDFKKSLAAGVMSVVATGASVAGDTKGLGSEFTSPTTPKSVLLQEATKSESSATIRTSIVNTLMDNPVTNNVIDDATGGSHSYTLPVLEKIIDVVSTGATSTLHYKINTMNDDWKVYDK